MIPVVFVKATGIQDVGLEIPDIVDPFCRLVVAHCPPLRINDLCPVQFLNFFGGLSIHLPFDPNSTAGKPRTWEIARKGRIPKSGWGRVLKVFWTQGSLGPKDLLYPLLIACGNCPVADKFPVPWASQLNGAFSSKEELGSGLSDGTQQKQNLLWWFEDKHF